MRNRRDLVMAMSVAEIFLLLLFVIWITSQAKEGPIDIEGLQARLAALEKDVESQKVELADLREWKEAYEAFIESLGQEKPKTKQELRDRTTRNLGKGGDDLPRCSPGANRLLVARVTDGITQLRIVNEYPSFPFQNGQVIEGDAVSQVILAASRIQQQNHCRFHYRLEYASPDDYLFGHKQFGSVFYPDGEIEIRK